MDFSKILPSKFNNMILIISVLWIKYYLKKKTNFIPSMTLHLQGRNIIAERLFNERASWAPPPPFTGCMKNWGLVINYPAITWIILVPKSHN